MNHILSYIESNAAKFGVSGTFLAFTLSQWSAFMSFTAALVTVLCMIPIGLTRWRKWWRGEDLE